MVPVMTLAVAGRKSVTDCFQYSSSLPQDTVVGTTILARMARHARLDESDPRNLALSGTRRADPVTGGPKLCEEGVGLAAREQRDRHAAFT